MRRRERVFFRVALGSPPPPFVSARGYRAHRSTGLNRDPVGSRHPRATPRLPDTHIPNAFFHARCAASFIGERRAACRPKSAIRLAHFAREPLFVASATVALRVRRNVTSHVVVYRDVAVTAGRQRDCAKRRFFRQVRTYSRPITATSVRQDSRGRGVNAARNILFPLRKYTTTHCIHRPRTCVITHEDSG